MIKWYEKATVWFVWNKSVGKYDCYEMYSINVENAHPSEHGAHILLA